MKIAARFPVKSEPRYRLILYGLHCLILALSLYQQGFSWSSFLIGVAVLISLFYSLKRYRVLTLAPDDLCWSGEHWIIQRADKQYAIEYLELQGSSWISSFACVLRLSRTGKVYRWLFTRSQLGQRAYSELCYLARENLKADNKADR